MLEPGSRWAWITMSLDHDKHGIDKHEHSKPRHDEAGSGTWNTLSLEHDEPGTQCTSSSVLWELNWTKAMSSNTTASSRVSLSYASKCFRDKDPAYEPSCPNHYLTYLVNLFLSHRDPGSSWSRLIVIQAHRDPGSSWSTYRDPGSSWSRRIVILGYHNHAYSEPWLSLRISRICFCIASLFYFVNKPCRDTSANGADLWQRPVRRI